VESQAATLYREHAVSIGKKKPTDSPPSAFIPGLETWVRPDETALKSVRGSSDSNNGLNE
jgi:hypothetical protein